MDFKETNLQRDQIIEAYNIIREDLQKGRDYFMKIFFDSVEYNKRNEFFIDIEVKLLEYCYNESYSAEKT